METGSENYKRTAQDWLSSANLYLQRNFLYHWRKFALLALVIFSVVLFFYSLGAEPLIDYDEATYAQVAKEGIIKQNYLTLYFNGEEWFDKPPLYFWSVIGLQLSGFSPEFSARFLPALAGVLSVLLVYCIVRHWTNKEWPAFLAAIILLMTAGFLETGRQARLDVPVVFALLATLYLFLLSKENKRYLIGAGALLGVAVMIKSVIGFLILPLLLLISIVDQRYRPHFDRHTLYALTSFLVVVLPWHIHQTAIHGWKFWNSYFFLHVIERFEKNILSHEAAVSAYFKALEVYVWPWIFILIVVAMLVIFTRGAPTPGGSKRFFFSILLYSLALFGLFAAAETKTIYYLVPIYPFIAILIALGMHLLEPLFARRDKVIIVAALIFLFVCATVITLWRGYHLDYQFNYHQRLAYDEKNIALIVKNEQLPVYFLDRDFWETIGFYSDRRDELRRYSGQTPPFFLVVPTHRLDGVYAVLPQNDPVLILYSGRAFVLLRVE